MIRIFTAENLASAVVAKEIINNTKEIDGLAGIRKKQIRDMKNIIKLKDDKVHVKRKITRRINRAIEEFGAFKIGKTGYATQRAKNYNGYDAMVLMAQSKSCKLIEELEGYYNDKYLSTKGNQNIKVGSAGKMTKRTGWYYLYVVLS